MQPRLEGHHQGEDAYEGRRRDQDPSHSFADLPVGVDGHAEQQSESDDLAHDRAVYQESGKAGEEDEATCREAQPWFYPRWPLSPATEDRAPNDECDPDAHSREHDSCGPNEAVVHWAPFLRCPVRRIGPTAEPTRVDRGGNKESENPESSETESAGPISCCAVHLQQLGGQHQEPRSKSD